MQEAKNAQVKSWNEPHVFRPHVLDKLVVLILVTTHPQGPAVWGCSRINVRRYSWKAKNRVERTHGEK